MTPLAETRGADGKQPNDEPLPRNTKGRIPSDTLVNTQLDQTRCLFIDTPNCRVKAEDVVQQNSISSTPSNLMIDEPKYVTMTLPYCLLQLAPLFTSQKCSQELEQLALVEEFWNGVEDTLVKTYLLEEAA